MWSCVWRQLGNTRWWHTKKFPKSGSGRPNTVRITFQVAQLKKRWKRRRWRWRQRCPLLSSMPLLQSHDALTLLRNGIAVPKLLYTLRTSDCSENAMLTYFDTLHRHSRTSSTWTSTSSRCQRWWTENPQRRHVGTFCLLGIDNRHAA